jgi:hypothetical protein
LIRNNKLFDYFKQAKTLYNQGTLIGKAGKVYRSFFSDGVKDERRGEFHSGNGEGRILGDDTLAEQALAQAIQQRRRAFAPAEAISAVCRGDGITENRFVSIRKLRIISEPGRVGAFTESLVRLPYREVDQRKAPESSRLPLPWKGW